MNSYDKKYGIDSSEEIIEDFHRKRVMFAIKDNKLFVAEPGLSYSHAVWFEKMCWITQANDLLMENITRGYVDNTGVYAYVGYDFRTNETVENEIKSHLSELLGKIGIPMPVTVGLGLKRDADGQWRPLKILT